MTNHADWFYDELRHAGVDYGDPAQAAVYDQHHQQFRDYEAQATALLDRLHLGADHTVIDMGVGTGAFAFYAAQRCRVGQCDLLPGWIPQLRAYGGSRRLGPTSARISPLK